MKKLILTLAVGFLGISAIQAQEITFEKEVIDYGNIQKGADGYQTFTFTNTGDAPLIINGVRTSCGCTVADYPKTPVASGDSGEIKVKYNTNIVSAFNKTIIVTSNAQESARKVLRIKGVVKD